MTMTTTTNSDNDGALSANLVPPPIAAPAGTAAPPATLDDVQKQLAKFGREQFKLNTLVETQQKQLQAALQQLSDNEARRERERSEGLARQSEEQRRERLKMIERLLPTLDGLDEAIAALDRTAQAKRPNWWQRLRGAETFALGPLVAWRSGLVMVRERLLGLLAEEDVRPIDSVGMRFDPELHVALQHLPATAAHPAGTVVREVRRGYSAGQMPLRYAEVVVARD